MSASNGAGILPALLPAGGGKADVVAYSLPGEAGEEALQTDEGLYAFQLAELTTAGTYSAVAEYVEARPELAAGLPKKDATRRSASLQFHVHPCPPVAVRWASCISAAAAAAAATLNLQSCLRSTKLNKNRFRLPEWCGLLCPSNTVPACLLAPSAAWRQHLFLRSWR